MDDLASLKNKVLDDLIVITDETDIEPAEKFELFIARYINSGETSLLGRAYEAAKQITDTKERGSALMQLLEEINVAEAENSAPTEAESQEQAPSDEGQHHEQPQHHDAQPIEVHEDQGQ